MGLTVAIVRRNIAGAQKHVIADVTFDSSYSTGGEAFTAQDVDKTEPAVAFDYVQADQKGVGNRICQYDPAAKTLMLFTALGTQAANASDQSTIVVRCHLVYGQVTG